MPAYLIGHITIKDEVLWQQYTAGVGESLVPFEAELIFRGKRNTVLAGEHSFNDTVVIKFPDMATIKKWFNSELYQKLIPIRKKAADVVIITYDG